MIQSYIMGSNRKRTQKISNVLRQYFVVIVEFYCLFIGDCFNLDGM